MAKKPKTAIQPTRSEDYPKWYQEVIKAGDLAEVSPVRGCMVIKPWGYSVWENIQSNMDRMFKETGHENAYFPLFIPMSYLEKEAKHVEGFAKECAVVTHHRLEDNGQGGLQPAGPLEEPLIVRPTSETIIGEMYARWVQSYRDLPILINQWANVVRWEMRTRLFLRTTEFLWQEGHTAHATEAEAREETAKILKLYAEFAQEYMAMPVVQGEKTEGERFPGAVATYSIEAMMQDRKALQAGTSHFLGQNFSKAQEIKFQNENGVEEYAWTTSWGVSTRLVGGLIMTHSDDDGLVLPPRLAPQHVVILPIFRDDEQASAVMRYCDELQRELTAQSYSGGPIRVTIDTRDIRGGQKKWDHVKRGVPIRVEVGPRDVDGSKVCVGRRDQNEKPPIADRNEFVATASKTLAEIQTALFEKADKMRRDNTHEITSLDDFREFFMPQNKNRPEVHGGFAMCHWAEGPEIDEVLQPLKVTVRCIPMNEVAAPSSGTCIFTGKPSQGKALFAKAY